MREREREKERERERKREKERIERKRKEENRIERKPGWYFVFLKLKGALLHLCLSLDYKSKRQETAFTAVF